MAVDQRSLENCRLVDRLMRPNELARTPSTRGSRGSRGSRGKSTNEHRQPPPFSRHRPMRRCRQATIYRIAASTPPVAKPRMGVKSGASPNISPAKQPLGEAREFQRSTAAHRSLVGRSARHLTLKLCLGSFTPQIGWRR